MSLTIAYVGNFQPRTDRGEPFSTESHLAATLERLGHQVVRLQESEMDARLVGVQVSQTGAHMLLWTRTWPERLKERGHDMLRNLQVPSVAYHLDLYAGLSRSTMIDEEPWWRCKYVFTADGGSDEFWNVHAVNHFWMPPAVYEPECYMAEPPGPERYEVIFVGSGMNGYHPEWPYRQHLIKWLRSVYGERFTLFGHGGKRECVRGAALNEVYASAKVVVGDSLCVNFEHERYWSDRVPETLGRGGFLIHPEIEGIGEEYPDLVTYTYNDFSDLQEEIDYFLANDEEREALRRKNHEHVKGRHTYTDRMQQMLSTLAGYEPTIAEAMFT